MNKLKLEMEFKDEAGKKFNLSLDNPKEDLTGPEIRIVMDDIVEKNIFYTKEGDIAEPVGARVITTTVEEMEI